MSSSNYTKISQLDKVTVDNLKSINGIVDLPIITTDISSGKPKIIDLIRSEIGKTIISSGLGNNYNIDIYLKPNENINFSFNDLGLYWDDHLDFEDESTYPYASIVVNNSPAEIYRLRLDNNITAEDDRVKLMSCEWQLENSEYKKIANKISISFFRTYRYSIDNDISINYSIAKMIPSESFLSNTDLLILRIVPYQLIIDKNINVDTNLSIPITSSATELSLIGKLPISANPNTINFTKSFSSGTYFEGWNINNITGANRTKKINNGKFINSFVQLSQLNEQFENYEILESDY